MKINNLRLGFATNSSSTHSIVFIKGVEDKYEKGEYGWGNFTLASKEAKISYLAQLLFQNLRPNMSEDMANIIIKNLLGTKAKPNGHIDHQSLFTLPQDWDKPSINLEFFKDFKQFLLKDGIVVLGGNDNTTKKHPLLKKSVPIHMFGYVSVFDNIPTKFKIIGDTSGKIVAKKEGDTWVVFNRKNGNKARITFTNTPKPYLKSSVPELVDIKITDKCSKNCAYCYQNSTNTGQHANTDWIGSLAYKMGQLGVFEVACGGGETTEHPDFLKILKTFGYYNVVPNFTTGTLKWLGRKDAAEIINSIGAFAFSVQNAKNVVALFNAIKTESVTKKRVPGEIFQKATIQYVMGSTPLGEFKKILEKSSEYGFPITLLGFKTTGRGAEFKPYDYSGWLNVVKSVTEKSGQIKIGIDTAIAAQYEEQLNKLGIPNLLYTTKEGAYSMYIDAVNQTMAPSSYASPDKTIPCNPYRFNEGFEKMEPYSPASIKTEINTSAKINRKK